MATFYSNHYSGAVGSTGHFTTLDAPVPAVPAGFGSARYRIKRAELEVPLSTDLGSGEIFRLMDFKSSDRIEQIFFSMDANFGATTTFSIGLYEKGSNNDGAVIDLNLFGSAIDWSGEIAYVDYFDQSTTLDGWDRGKELWDLANIGGGTYSSDPEEDWTLTCETTQDITVTAATAIEFKVAVTYTAGD